MARVIMIQGTMSNAGKSFVAAGLCRVFHQDGFRVAPFKSQNMALNSYVTREGLEMGRAQVMQAEAAGMEPSADMNPILLKPTSDVGSQVIVNGIARGNMDAKSYFARKKELVPDILAAFSRLSKRADIIVIEGAGSPAEINLKENDIVNMGLAKLIDAPVLLVGDIDPGGVFAQLVGTVCLLEEEERRRIKGFVINKFRGDPSLLTSGIEMLTERTGIPTLGILPYIHISLDDEDSLSGRLRNEEDRDDPERGNLLTGKDEAVAEIAVIRLPHISNFTDFDVFDMLPACRIRYIASPQEMENADLVIVPGTKNTVGDLRWLRETGLADMIWQLAEEGTPVFGICGGYQMLGESVSDPDHVETKEGEKAGEDGLCLLPVKTVLRKTKVLAQVEGHFVCGGDESVYKTLSGMAFQGYEIHMGSTETITDSVKPFLMMKEVEDGTGAPMREDGVISGNVCGSYVHGIFDADGIAETLVHALADRKEKMKTNPKDASCRKESASGLETGNKMVSLQTTTGHASVHGYKEFRESQYNFLAEMIRKNMDMSAVYECLKEASIR